MDGVDGADDADGADDMKMAADDGTYLRSCVQHNFVRQSADVGMVLPTESSYQMHLIHLLHQ